jgi:hypothetical protein
MVLTIAGTLTAVPGHRLLVDASDDGWLAAPSYDVDDRHRDCLINGVWGPAVF